jgi:hypothetical protein
VEELQRVGVVVVGKVHHAIPPLPVLSEYYHVDQTKKDMGNSFVDPGSSAFLPPRSGIRDEVFRIPDPAHFWRNCLTFIFRILVMLSLLNWGYS